MKNRRVWKGVKILNSSSQPLFPAEISVVAADRDIQEHNSDQLSITGVFPINFPSSIMQNPHRNKERSNGVQ